VERAEHFLYGLIARLWSSYLDPWAEALLQRCLQAFEWKILAWHNVNTVQAPNPIEQYLRRRNIHDRKMPAQRFSGPFGTQQAAHYELLYALRGVDLYSGAETETVALGKALAQDHGLRLGQDGKGILPVPLGPLEGVITHRAVGNDINASHQQHRSASFWYDHVSQHQGSHSRYAWCSSGQRQHRFVQQGSMSGNFQASPTGDSVNGARKRPERAGVGDAYGDEHGYTQSNTNEGKQRPQAMLC